MSDLADVKNIDALAADLFRTDHPDRCWDSSDGIRRIGVASAIEKAVYRGFATARKAAASRSIPGPAIAAAALAADKASLKPRL